MASDGKVYSVLRGLKDFTRGITPRWRGVTALPTHPWASACSRGSVLVDSAKKYKNSLQSISEGVMYFCVVLNVLLVVSLSAHCF